MENQVNVEGWSFNVVANFNCRSHLDFEQTGYRMKSGSGVAPSSIYEPNSLPVSIYEPKSAAKHKFELDMWPPLEVDQLTHY